MKYLLILNIILKYSVLIYIYANLLLKTSKVHLKMKIQQLETITDKEKGMNFQKIP